MRSLRMVRVIVAGLTVVMLPTVAAQSASAATCGPLAVHGHWPMDEPPGASTMHDVAGGNNGTVTYAKTGLTVPEHTGFGSFYRFGRGPEFPKGSMVTVTDTDILDPGACDFAVEISVNWDKVTPDPNNHTTFNVTQKGLSTAPANWKIEVDGGQRHFATAICTFDGANDGRGEVRVRSIAKVPNNGSWTTLRCERHGNDFLVRVNGGPAVKSTVAGIGPVENSSFLSVAAKKLNDSDTFPGDVDELVFSSGK